MIHPAKQLRRLVLERLLKERRASFEQFAEGHDCQAHVRDTIQNLLDEGVIVPALDESNIYRLAP